MYSGWFVQYKGGPVTHDRSKQILDKESRVMFSQGVVFVL